MAAGRIAVLCLALACLSVRPAGSGNALTIKVTPPIAMAPAFILVRTTIEADEDNRMLEVTAESDDLYRSSQIPLNGALAPRINDIRFNGLPEGRYEITASVIGSRGRRSAVSRSMLVAHGVR